MNFNLNEKYLLKFISGNEYSSDNELLVLLCDMGIKLKFKNPNPIYQTIDELIYEDISVRK